MRVIVCEPGKTAELREIPNTLKALQKTVGGYIETLHPSRAALRNIDNTVMIFNEEGRLRNLPPNRFGIVGTLLFTGVEGDEFRSLTADEVVGILEQAQLKGD